MQGRREARGSPAIDASVPGPLLQAGMARLRASPPAVSSALPGALRCRRKFLRQFPGGFRDPTYLDWERDYKWETHRRWREALPRAEFQRLVLDPTVVPTPPGRLVRGLPVILDRVLTAGLAPDPAARPARASDLLHLLEEVGRRHGTLRIPFADLRHSA